jgi:hypothetical protein
MEQVVEEHVEVEGNEPEGEAGGMHFEMAFNVDHRDLKSPSNFA